MVFCKGLCSLFDAIVPSLLLLLFCRYHVKESEARSSGGDSAFAPHSVGIASTSKA